MEPQVAPVQDSNPKAIFAVDYEEFKPETYKGCFVTIHDKGSVRRLDSTTGDVAEDMAVLRAKIKELGISEGESFYASSVDNYASDCAKAGIWI